MEDYEERTGGSILAIPHNGNLSNGLMFATERLNGKPMDKAYAERRMQWEPLYEVTQIKGDGEAHPLISPNDEFADYGTWDLAARHPGWFAAAAPICGGGDERVVARFAALPLSVWHGGADSVVTPARSRAMVEALGVVEGMNSTNASDTPSASNCTPGWLLPLAASFIGVTELTASQVAGGSSVRTWASTMSRP